MSPRLQSAASAAWLARIVAGLMVGGGTAIAAAGPSADVFLAGAPLDTLTATRERPLFLPSRRPPTRGTVTLIESAPPLGPAIVDEPPRLTLLGIIRATAGSAAAVVMDEADRTSLSLRPGEGRRGWIVRSIGRDAVTLQKQQQTVTLTFLKAPPVPRLPAE